MFIVKLDLIYKYKNESSTLICDNLVNVNNVNANR